MRMNSPEGKAILAMVREAPYAHAGEAEAIDLALSPVPRHSSRQVLDVGCGLGGTADYVQRDGWGHVTGFDIDAVSVAKAQRDFPECTFTACDVENAGSRWQETFDLIYSFNACYAFPDQPTALRQLALTAKDGATLVIFDYTDPDNNFPEADFARRENAATWKPLHPPSFTEWAAEAGWKLESFTDLTPQYVRWYTEFVHRIEEHQGTILAKHPPDVFHFVLGFYSNLLHSIRAGQMGGGLFSFKKAIDS